MRWRRVRFSGLACDFVMLVTLTKMPLGRHYIAMFEATQNVMLKPTESWREALLDHRVMDLFFTVSNLLFYYLFSLVQMCDVLRNKSKVTPS